VTPFVLPRLPIGEDNPHTDERGEAVNIELAPGALHKASNSLNINVSPAALDPASLVPGVLSVTVVAKVDSSGLVFRRGFRREDGNSIWVRNGRHGEQRTHGLGKSVYRSSIGGPGAPHTSSRISIRPFVWDLSRVGECIEHVGNAMHPAALSRISGQTSCLTVQKPSTLSPMAAARAGIPRTVSFVAL
jgi:hypothetical protein